MSETNARMPDKERQQHAKQASGEPILLYQELNMHLQHLSLLPLFLGECLFNVAESAKRLWGIFYFTWFFFLTIMEGKKSSNKVQSTSFSATHCLSYDHTCTRLRQAAKSSKPLSYHCCALRIHILVGKGISAVKENQNEAQFFSIWLTTHECTATDAPVKVVLAQQYL